MKRRSAQAGAALDWLAPLQVLDVVGDWASERPQVRPGGWAFQYANPHYPDLDDTAVVVMAMDRARPDRRPFRFPIERAVEWIAGLQSRNGGWAAFDADNTYDYLNNIPFADHGALLDPPTEDVTRAAYRCSRSLEKPPDTSTALARRRSTICCARKPRQGSWYGRWGMNYIYGTWSVLCALNAAGIDHGVAGGAQGGRLARRHPERRRRLGRGRHKLPARLSGP